MQSITVYTTPICARCKIVKRWLDTRGIPYSTVDLTTSPDDAKALKALGYTEAPITVVSYPDGDIHFGGVNVAMLTEHCMEIAA